MPRELKLSYILYEELMICILNQILLGQYSEGEWNGDGASVGEKKIA
jgi:hypothetical protein